MVSLFLSLSLSLSLAARLAPDLSQVRTQKPFYSSFLFLSLSLSLTLSLSLPLACTFPLSLSLSLSFFFPPFPPSSSLLLPFLVNQPLFCRVPGLDGSFAERNCTNAEPSTMSSTQVVEPFLLSSSSLAMRSDTWPLLLSRGRSVRGSSKNLVFPSRRIA